MAEEAFKDATLNWFLVEADRDARDTYIKRIINVLSEKDYKKFFSQISKNRKRRKDQQQQHLATVKKAKAEATAEGSGSVQTSKASLSVPTPLAQSGWLKNWTDVEKVEIPLKNPGKKKYEQKAAIVSVVNSKQVEIFKAKIYRAKGSYRVTPHSTRINGITSSTLQEADCLPETDVYEQRVKILEAKLIVGIELENDFTSMDLDIGYFDVFDLQAYFFRVTYSIHGKRIVEHLGIRSLTKHYLNIDMQVKDKPHDCTVDALYCLRIFLEVYCKLSPPPLTKDSNYKGTNYIEHFKG